MLDVTGCTCPTGLVWRGVFDATGVQYKVPEWVVVEPEGIVDEDEELNRTASVEAAKANQVEADEEKDDTPSEIFSVHIRTSHDSRDVLVQVQRRDAVAKIIDKVKDTAKLDPLTKIRLVYGGRVYSDHEVLEAQPYWNFDNDFVVSGFVFQ